MILILEDNFSKIQMLLLNNEERIGKQSIFITGYQSEAEAFMRIHPEEMTLVLDGELHPGAGFGLNFLVWAINTYKHWIKKVVPISMSPDIREQMVELCRVNDVELEVW